MVIILTNNAFFEARLGAVLFTTTLIRSIIWNQSSFGSEYLVKNLRNAQSLTQDSLTVVEKFVIFFVGTISH